MTPEELAQLDAVVALIEAMLTGNVLGVYQYGSAVSGTLRPRSDLDVLVVVKNPTTARQRERLVRGLMTVSSRPGVGTAGRPVEVTVVRHDRVTPWRPPPEREFQYGEWLREQFEAGEIPGPEVDPDLTTLLTTALTASRALVGPPLDRMIEPIPHDHLVASMRAAVPALLEELTDDTRNVLLTLARIWHTTRTGEIVAKDEAAAWALERMPPAATRALSHARSAYLGEEEESFADLGDAQQATADFLAAAIRGDDGTP